jgi:ATP-dependent DNA ligase
LTGPAGRADISALLLAAHERGKLHHVGKVGTGFDGETLASPHQRFRPLILRQPVYLGLREDKRASEVALPEPGA